MIVRPPYERNDVNMYLHIHMYIYIYIYVFIYISSSPPDSVRSKWNCLDFSVLITSILCEASDEALRTGHICVYIYIYIYMIMCIYIYIYMYIHICMYV